MQITADPLDPHWIIQERVMSNIRAPGCVCPTCGGIAAEYYRSISARDARLLIIAYKVHQYEPFHAPTFFDSVKGGANYSPTLDAAKHFGFVEQVLEKREDGGYAGFWRFTPEGANWLCGLSTTPFRTAFVYMDRVTGWTGQREWTVRQSLGSKFSLNDIYYGPDPGPDPGKDS